MWHLPAGYNERIPPAYHDDEPHHTADMVHQPEVYEVARYLVQSAGRSTVIDVGCGSGRKLRDLGVPSSIGIDFGPNIEFCRRTHTDFGTWRKADLLSPDALSLAELANDRTVVVCADVVEHMPDPTILLRLLAAMYARGAIVLTSTPDRIRVRGADHRGPPPNGAHVREWALDEYVAVLNDAGLAVSYSGYTVNNNVNRELKTIVTISDRSLDPAAISDTRQRPLAIISAFNEDDFIGEVIADWLREGCDVHLIDNWSTDKTLAIARAWAARFPARVQVERYPATEPAYTYDWTSLLRRKEEIAERHPGCWIIHSDADELRRAPFTSLNMADALALAAVTGANRVDFRCINFRPASFDEPKPGEVEKSMLWFEFGTRTGHFVQSKAWRQPQGRVDLASSGGHAVQFPGACDFPYKFLLKHYQLRSPAHARRKIFQDRLPRTDTDERHVLRWHVQYDHYRTEDGFIWPRSDLMCWTSESEFWRDHGLLVVVDLVQNRVLRGWMAGGR